MSGDDAQAVSAQDIVTATAAALGGLVGALDKNGFLNGRGFTDALRPNPGEAPEGVEAVLAIFRATISKALDWEEFGLQVIDGGGERDGSPKE